MTFGAIALLFNSRHVLSLALGCNCFAFCHRSKTTSELLIAYPGIALGPVPEMAYGGRPPIKLRSQGRKEGK